MEAKDKALELFNKFEGYSLNIFSAEIEPRKQKEMANICVDEILQTNDEFKAKVEQQGMWGYCDKAELNKIVEYWEQVKKEINAI